ncbi:hypothetical protein HED60_11920 [Planctomycetales bacterium ZRK34]|nr:hypothetical protein HED60_11920 [Planctomycetales bacterium ZRK34]
MTEPITQFDELMADLADGTLSQAQRGALFDRLRDDPDCRDQYVEFMLLHADLAWDRGTRIQPADLISIEQKPTPTLRRSRSVWYSAALAAAVAIGLTVWFMTMSPSSTTTTPSPPDRAQRVATVTRTDQAVLAGSSLPMSTGAELPAGSVQLVSGSMQVMFGSGAMVDLHGPCEFEMTGINSGRLSRGRLAAYVPAAAAGFTVDAPHQVRLTDLGTRFELVVADDEHHMDAWVREGSVEIHSPRFGSRILHAGQSLSLRDGEPARPLLTDVSVSSGAAYRIVRGGFNDGARAYVDRDYTWQAIDAPSCPPMLHGADYVQTANEDNSDSGLSVKLTLSEPATVWVLWNPRAPLPQWLTEQFESKDWSVSLDMPQGRHLAQNQTLTYSVWTQRVAEAGQVTLGPRLVSQQPVNAGMYCIAVTPPLPIAPPIDNSTPSKSTGAK